MKKRNIYFSIGAALCVLVLFAVIWSGEQNGDGSQMASGTEDGQAYGEIEETQEESAESLEEAENPAEQMPHEELETEEEQPQIMTEDWSSYFDGMNGAAVIYDRAENRYAVYNEELAETRRSPCSTFKIISSLIALEQGIIIPDDSVRPWSGETFWNAEWNRDIGFEDAFRTSCVWYFREVIDEIGKETMQNELEKLPYGNCDISDWKGEQNTNNSNRALTGFWIESSLKISPKEQAEVMERIFGEDSAYSEETTELLKEVMRLPDEYETDLPIYGKTGMGKAEGVTVDAWFTGFAELPETSVYFCIYLGQSEGMNATSAAARDIAVRLVSDYCLQTDH